MASSNPQNLKIDFIPPGPVAGAFLNCRARVSALVGPYGSGKTSVAMIAVLKAAGEMPADSNGVIRTRALWVRSTYQMLTSSTLPTVGRVLPRSVGKITLGSPIQHVIKARGFELTIDFLALDMDADRRRIEGATYAIIVVDEARECPWGIIQTALTRLRETTDDGRQKPLRAMFVSNPSGKSHWLYQKFVAEPVEGWQLHMQPGGRTPQAENMKYLPKNYYDDMAKTSDPAFVAVHVDAAWGDTVLGAAVIPEFSPILHVAPADMQISPVLPLVLGIDAGPTLHPAALIAQIVPLKDGSRQVRILGEWFAENCGAERAAHELRSYVARAFPELPIDAAYIDPSAAQQRDNASERVFLNIWKAITGWPIRAAQSNLLSVRIEGTRGLFTRLAGGLPAVWISPRCTNLIRALAGEYRFKQSVTSQGLATNETQIDKLNRPFADLGDALTYLALGSGEFELLRRIKPKRRGAAVAENDYGGSLFRWGE
jgi:hypothetical protein